MLAPTFQWFSVSSCKQGKQKHYKALQSEKNKYIPEA